MVACKKNEAPETKGWVYSDKEDPLEKQNLQALCDASSEIAAIEGVQDRMSRISEITVLTSPTTDLLDALMAMEGHERLPVLKKLVAKYKFEKSCVKGLRMFDRGPPRSAAQPRKPPKDGKGPPVKDSKPPPSGSTGGKGEAVKDSKPPQAPAGNAAAQGDKTAPKNSSDSGAKDDPSKTKEGKPQKDGTKSD
jgi:hypothetical protein